MQKLVDGYSVLHSTIIIIGLSLLKSLFSKSKYVTYCPQNVFFVTEIIQRGYISAFTIIILIFANIILNDPLILPLIIPFVLFIDDNYSMPRVYPETNKYGN